MSSRRTALLGFLAGIIVVGGGLLLVKLWKTRSAPPTPVVVESETPATTTKPVADQWTTYRNDIFGFSIEHPASWKIAESNKDGTPMISIYKPGSAIAQNGAGAPEPPYTHWNNATHVSFFPSGIPTEGVVGLTRSSTVDFRVDVERALDYLTVPEKGSIQNLDSTEILARAVPWATFVGFASPAVNWRPWGFVWAGVALPDVVPVCLHDGKPLAAESCDPMAGDEVIHTGKPDPADRAIEERMLASLRFVD